MRGARKSVLRSGLFDPVNLAENGHEDALSECEGILTEDNIESIVEDLLSQPTLLEFVLAGKLDFASCPKFLTRCLSGG
jgi:hypothetical protein